jgi:hypothetical protein
MNESAQSYVHYLGVIAQYVCMHVCVCIFAESAQSYVRYLGVIAQ